MDVLRCLGVGKENRVSLETLQTLTGMNERAIRMEIQRLRNKERIMILSSPRKDGYWIAADDEWDEVDQFEKMMRGYGSSPWQSVMTAQEWKKRHAQPEQTTLC